MKTAVSIPDALFDAADQLAARLGISRSQLYARALARELAVESDDDVTARLNEIYSSVPSQVDPDLKTAQRRRLQSAEW